MVDSRTAPAVGTSDRRHAAQRHAAIDGAGWRDATGATRCPSRGLGLQVIAARAGREHRRERRRSRGRGAWPSDTLTGGRVRRLARPAAPRPPPPALAARPGRPRAAPVPRRRLRPVAAVAWRTHRPPPAGAGSVVNRCGGGWSAVGRRAVRPRPRGRGVEVQRGRPRAQPPRRRDRRAAPSWPGCARSRRRDRRRRDRCPTACAYAARVLSFAIRLAKNSRNRAAASGPASTISDGRTTSASPSATTTGSAAAGTRTPLPTADSPVDEPLEPLVIVHERIGQRVEPFHRLLRPVEPHLDPVPKNRHPLGQARQLRVEGLDGKRHPDPGHPRLPEFGHQPRPSLPLAAKGGPGPVFRELAQELGLRERSLVAGELRPKVCINVAAGTPRRPGAVPRPAG